MKTSLRKLRSRTHISNIKNNENQSQQANALLKAANENASTARNLYVTLLLFIIYTVITVGSTTDEQLLRDGPVAVPLLPGANLPVSAFYALAPWLLLFLHIDVLLHFTLLAKKLHAFSRSVIHLADPEETYFLRTQLTNFPFSHWLAGDDNRRSLQLFQGLVVWLTIIILPLMVLVYAQVGFLPYHSELTTWGHRIAIGIDVIALFYFWPSIRQPVYFSDRWRYWLSIRQLGKGILPLALFSGFIIFSSFFVLTIPHEKIETLWLELFSFAKVKAPKEANAKIETTYRCLSLYTVVENIIKPSSIVKVHDQELFGQISLPKSLSALCPTAIVFHSDVGIFKGFHRTLSLTEKLLIGNNVPLEALADIGKDDEEKSNLALAKIEPLNLQNRDLRYADFYYAKLFKADLRNAVMSGVDLANANLQGANLKKAQLQYAQLSGVELQDGNLSSVEAQGAWLAYGNLKRTNLLNAQLQGAELSNADLKAADLRNVQLQMASLAGTNLQAATLSNAQLQGALLIWTELQGANLDKAQLQSAMVFEAELQGANLSNAKLQGASISLTKLEGAILDNTELQSTFFGDSKMQFNPVHHSKPGIWERADAEKIKNLLINPTFENERINGVISNIDARIGKSTEGFYPEHCWGEPLSTCYTEKDKSKFAEGLARTWLEIACSEKDTAPAIANQMIRLKYGTYLASIDKNAVLTFAYGLLNPDCKGGAALPQKIKNELRKAIAQTPSN